MTRPLRSELPARFGEIDKKHDNGKETLHWPREREFMQLVDFPTRLKPLGVVRVYCNKLMAVPLRQALDNIVERGLAGQLKEWNGCFEIRKARGDLLRLSVHSYGLAVDINASTNQRGTPGDMSPELRACFEDVGFVWGGTWETPDPMHFQFVTED